MEQGRRATAFHEAGHAVMAYLLGVAFTEISVTEDDDSLGRVGHRPPGGDWLQPDIEVNARTRNWLEGRIMISLAGAETEAAWWKRQPDAPDDWEERVGIGAAHDRRLAIDFGDYVCGGPVPELEAYIEWLRQRVLGFTGRGPGFEVASFSPNALDFEVDRYRSGDPRFWALVEALADAVQEAGTLRWRKAREILRDADHRWVISQHPRMAALLDEDHGHASREEGE